MCHKSEPAVGKDLPSELRHLSEFASDDFSTSLEKGWLRFRDFPVNGDWFAVVVPCGLEYDFGFWNECCSFGCTRSRRFWWFVRYTFDNPLFGDPVCLCVPIAEENNPIRCLQLRYHSVHRSMPAVCMPRCWQKMLAEFVERKIDSHRCCCHTHNSKTKLRYFTEKRNLFVWHRCGGSFRMNNS